MRLLFFHGWIVAVVTFVNMAVGVKVRAVAGQLHQGNI
jgi:hypothetical protein